MTEEAVELLLIEELEENLRLNGVSAPNVTGATAPVGGLPCFDSLTAAEVLTSIETRVEEVIGKEITFDISLFFTQKKTQLKKGATLNSLKVSEITKNIYKEIQKAT